VLFKGVFSLGTAVACVVGMGLKRDPPVVLSRFDSVVEVCFDVIDCVKIGVVFSAVPVEAVFKNHFFY
jgi:hypothetical protein